MNRIKDRSAASGYGAKVMLKCKTCGAERLEYKSNKRKYCSRKCVWLSKNQTENVKCLECGGTFIDWKSKNRKYCSKKCSSLSNWKKHDFRKKHIGYKHSEAVKSRMSKIAKEKKFGVWMSGKKLKIETRIKQSEKLRGDKSYRWKGGITPENTKQRLSIEMKLWREEVFRRDDWTCKKCKKRGGKIQADHIIPFSVNKELLFDVNNGQTLCVPCHVGKTRKEHREKAYG